MRLTAHGISRQGRSSKRLKQMLDGSDLRIFFMDGVTRRGMRANDPQRLDDQKPMTLRSSLRRSFCAKRSSGGVEKVA